MSDFRLVQPLFDGPLDIVADIHGEIEAVRALLSWLGYDERGWHPEGRRLVFLGDLTDRGPDSPAVVALVRGLVEAGFAQCVLGNHELNLLRGQEKHGNAWFLGKSESLDRTGRIIPQVPADEGTRAEILRFFRQLPLALEREDLRVVHACWDSAMVDLARDAADVLDLYDRSVHRIREDLAARGVTEDFEVRFTLQNRNPVKVLATGHERPTAEPFEAGGRLRDRERVRWWEDYADDTFCVFGHYWRTPVPNARKTQRLFDADPPHAALGAGRAMCIDYSAGARWLERLAVDFNGTYSTRLAALRWPEKTLVFDDGERVPVAPPRPRPDAWPRKGSRRANIAAGPGVYSGESTRRRARLAERQSR